MNGVDLLRGIPEAPEVLPNRYQIDPRDLAAVLRQLQQLRTFNPMFGADITGLTEALNRAMAAPAPAPATVPGRSLYLDPRTGTLTESDINPDPRDQYRIVHSWDDAQAALAAGDLPIVVNPGVLTLSPGDRMLAIEQARLRQYESLGGQPPIFDVNQRVDPARPPALGGELPGRSIPPPGWYNQLPRGSSPRGLLPGIPAAPPLSSLDPAAFQGPSPWSPLPLAVPAWLSAPMTAFADPSGGGGVEFAHGGLVRRTGRAKVHRGEYVVNPAAVHRYLGLLQGINRRVA